MYPAQNSITKKGRETRYGVTGVLAVTNGVAARFCLDDPHRNAHTMMWANEAWLAGEQHFCHQPQLTMRVRSKLLSLVEALEAGGFKM